MAKRLVYELRLSDSMQQYLTASLDLLEAVLNADEALVTDEILNAAEELQAVIENQSGNL